MSNLFEADVVAREESTDGDAIPVPADASVGADQASLEVTRMGDGLELLGEGAVRGVVEVGR